MHVRDYRYRQSGQVLLITILILTVATTIALSLIGRATLDFSMSNQLEESTRAFNAAEAGIEAALKSGMGGSVTIGSGTSYAVSVNTVGGSTGVYQMMHKTTRGATDMLWLVEHNSDGSVNETPVYTRTSLDVCWSQPSGSNPVAALIIGVLYKEGTDGSYKLVKVAADPDAASRANNFDAGVGTGGCGNANTYVTTVNFTTLGLTLSGAAADTLLGLRLRPEYADTTISVNAGAQALPTQGKSIQSVGTTGNGVTRKVIVYQSYRAPSSIFDSVIYSQDNFSHN